VVFALSSGVHIRNGNRAKPAGDFGGTPAWLVDYARIGAECYDTVRNSESESLFMLLARTGTILCGADRFCFFLETD
jgi:hypothetical protein